MKLVLLPGMDGTGELFTEFLSYFDGEHLVISLPQNGPQDHASLAQAVSKQLPTSDYILLAESFSGGIVPELLKTHDKHLKGVIFVASFLTSPNQYLLAIAKRLSIKTLASAPLSGVFHKLLFLGKNASNTQLSKFVQVVKSVPEAVLKNRLTVISQQQLPNIRFDIPAIYIRATQDKLITKFKADEFSQVFSHIKQLEIAGPHFILQAKPEESALLITRLIYKGILNRDH